MSDVPEPAPEAARVRPWWQWLLLAVAPGLVGDVTAGMMALASNVKGLDLLGELAMMIMLAIPLLTIPYLIALSKPYLRARHPEQDGGGKAGFVLGFCLVNAFLWGGGCVVVISNLNFH